MTKSLRTDSCAGWPYALQDVREPGFASTHPLPHTYSEDSVLLAREDFLPTPQPADAAFFSTSVQANRGGYESQPKFRNTVIPA